MIIHINGVQCSGKSYICNRLKKNKKVICIDTDDIQLQAYKNIRNKSSYKCKLSHSRIPLSHDTWITTRVVRDETGESYDKYVLNTFQTAYIPLWYANKIGLILKSKNN